MSDGALEYRVAGSMIQGQIHIDLRNGDKSHIARAVHIQLPFVILDILILHGPGIRILSKPAVVVQRRLPDRGVCLVVQLRHALCVALDSPGLVHTVPVIAESGISRNGYTGKQNQHQDRI